jgi:outer membrane immunogenic protein
VPIAKQDGSQKIKNLEEKTMKKNQFILIAALALAGAAPNAYAQAKSFEGFSIGANFNVHSNSFNQVRPGATSRASATDQNVGLFAIYTFVLGESFVIGVGASADMSSYKIGSIGATEYTIKDKKSFDLTPGYAVSDTTLVYAKISAINAKSVSSTGTNTVDNSGNGYGIGTRVNLAKNVFVQAEYVRGNLPDKVYPGEIYSPLKQDQYSFGIAYKF